MPNYLKRMFAVGAAGALALSLAACGGDSSDDSPSSSNSGGNTEASAGGTLYYLQHYPFESVDPQRSYYGLELANFRRTIYRGLVGFPITEDPVEAAKPVADLATDTGTKNDDATQWSFTLKDGVKWEDGSDITCEDFRYGASRVFANDLITGGPNYIISYLDVKDYPGPYKATPAQQSAFDKAIECSADHKTITYHFNKPWADFPLAVASLEMMDPYKKDVDEGAKSTWKVLANGPYKVEGGVWDKNKGATLVRNDNYDAATDDPTLRKALPDKIEYQINPSDTSVELIIDRMIANAGNDQYAVAAPTIPPTRYSQIQGPVKDRVELTDSPYNFYLVPNFKTLTNLDVRKALAAAVDLDGVVKARGGEYAATTAESIVNSGVGGYQDNPAFAGPNSGDVEAAKALLEGSGEKTPYPITFTYSKSDTNDKIAAVLKENWDAAGFKTTLDPLTDTYYDVISKPEKNSDVMMAGWGADWPSAMTVTPPLFDSRPNFSSTTCGQDYGCYESDAFNALVDKAANSTSIDEQNGFLQQADAQLGEDVAYIPLYVLKNYYIRGGKVTGYVVTPSTSMYPDLGAIGVEQ
jgi:peptide/nickel transport system substrate-binding protein